MTKLTPPPKIKLSRLRDIGWSLWDPIGLLSENSSWDDPENLPFADEYDTYLIHAASRLRRGAAISEVTNYLVAIETKHMGLGFKIGRSKRARRVAIAIQTDKYLWTYPEKRL